MIFRKKTKVVKIGSLAIGGSHSIAVQSMTKTKTSDVKATVAQIRELEKAGCQIIRCAIPDEASAYAIKEIKKEISIPLVADIHFDHKLAIIAAEMGADKLRINPGNIGGLEKIKSVVAVAKERNIPIRVGVNSGSLEKELKAKSVHPEAESLVTSALRNVRILEELNFHDIIVAVKSTSVPITIEAYKLLSDKIDYPLHLGITESGLPKFGIIKSSIGIGALLSMGIGDTLRVSLTGNPVEEIAVGLEILKSLELITKGITIISCPTCGRCRIEMQKVAEEVERKTKDITYPMKVAIMGCEVNGPGEASDADIGIAGGNGIGLIFKKGKPLRQVAEADMVTALLEEINLFIREGEKPK